MNWIKGDIPGCMSALSVPQITAVHTSNAGICWWTLGQGHFAGNDAKITAGALLDMLTFRPDSVIRFLSAVKEEGRRENTQGQRIWVKLANPVPEIPETKRDRPAYTVRILKQAVKPGKQAELAEKENIPSQLPPKATVTVTLKSIQKRATKATRATGATTATRTVHRNRPGICPTCRILSR